MQLAGVAETIIWGADADAEELVQRVKDAGIELGIGFYGKIFFPEEVNRRVAGMIADLTEREGIVPAPYLARGQSLIATNQFEKAVEDFNAALNVDNRLGDAWAGRGFAYEKMGRKQEASEPITPDSRDVRAGACNSP